MVESNFVVKFTPVANNDVEEIYSYISLELFAEDAAVNLLSRMESNIMRLKYFPFSGSNLANDILRHKGYRKVIIDNYIVFYIVDEKEKQVIIMRVLYGKQKYEDLLWNRKQSLLQSRSVLMTMY